MLDELGVVVVEEGFTFICEQGDVRTVAGHHNNLHVLVVLFYIAMQM